MKNTGYTSQELAQEIVDEIDSMHPALPVEDFAPVSEVQKWLDAMDNEGDAEEISSEIYKILDRRG